MWHRPRGRRVGLAIALPVGPTLDHRQNAECWVGFCRIPSQAIQVTPRRRTRAGLALGPQSCLRTGNGRRPRHRMGLELMEPMVRIELTTDGLRNRCSTTELHWPPKDVVRHDLRPNVRGNRRPLAPALPRPTTLLSDNMRPSQEATSHLLMSVGKFPSGRAEVSSTPALRGQARVYRRQTTAPRPAGPGTDCGVTPRSRA